MNPTQFKYMGADNVNDPTALDVEKGQCPLLHNVDPDNTGGYATRKGQTPASVGAVHSGWGDGVTALVVRGGFLCSFNGATTTQLIAVHPTLPMAYEKVNDVIVASNGVDYILLEGGAAYSATPDSVEFSIAPPGGSYLAFYNSRLYMAEGGVLYYTKPFSLDACDSRTYRIPITQDVITGIAAVDDGIFVGTTKEAFFLRGMDATKFEMIKVADYGVVPHTMQRVPSEDLGMEKGTAAVWAATRGFCVGGNGGAFENRSSGRYALPAATSGASMVRLQDGLAHQVVVLDSAPAYNQYIPPPFEINEV
jgi:hypothetical protein